MLCRIQAACFIFIQRCRDGSMVDTVSPSPFIIGIACGAIPSFPVASGNYHYKYYFSGFIHEWRHHQPLKPRTNEKFECITTLCFFYCICQLFNWKKTHHRIRANSLNGWRLAATTHTNHIIMCFFSVSFSHEPMVIWLLLRLRPFFSLRDYHYRHTMSGINIG